MAKMTLIVNGEQRSVDVRPDTPLLWVLRDDLQLTGTKFSCGMSLCGSCTVHLDGQPIRSCIMPVSTANNRNITTIEGLSQSQIGKALQNAWIEEDVSQCGYCQSGQLMSAAALLTSNSDPSDAEIDAALSGNLCRCGTYSRVRKAIHRAAKEV